MNAPAPRYDDELDEMLNYYAGDFRAAITDLLRDRDFLLREIELASLAMSPGYTRGWKPTVFSKRGAISAPVNIRNHAWCDQ